MYPECCEKPIVITHFLLTFCALRLYIEQRIGAYSNFMLCLIAIWPMEKFDYFPPPQTQKGSRRAIGSPALKRRIKKDCGRNRHAAARAG
jgi:hypothetical protein